MLHFLHLGLETAPKSILCQTSLRGRQTVFSRLRLSALVAIQWLQKRQELALHSTTVWLTGQISVTFLGMCQSGWMGRPQWPCKHLEFPYD